MLSKIAKYFYLSSLNVVIGTLCCGYMFWKLNDENQPNVPSIILLGTCTWLIYILDRMLDLKDNNTTDRHTFHYSNKKNLLIIVYLLLVSSSITAFFLPTTILKFGIVVTIILTIYFYFLHNKLKKTEIIWIKEPITAFFYTIAVVCPPLLVKNQVLIIDFYITIGFFLLAIQNLIIFSYFEKMIDDKSNNICSYLGLKSGYNIALLISLIIILLSILVYMNYPKKIEKKIIIIELLMSFCQVAVILLKSKTQQKHIYRILGDGVFLLPCFVFI